MICYTIAALCAMHSVMALYDSGGLYFIDPSTSRGMGNNRRLQSHTRKQSNINDLGDGEPIRSPSNGTDIISHPISLIKCQNQTRCIKPELQLERTYNVYYCKRVSYGIRFYFLVREGLLLHPNLQMVETPEQADIVLYLPESAAWHKSECNNPNFANKLVVMDGQFNAGVSCVIICLHIGVLESDGPTTLDVGRPNWNIVYFKRSFVRRHDGVRV